MLSLAGGLFERSFLFLFFAIVSHPLLYSQEAEDISNSIGKMIKGSGVPALAAAAVLDGKIVSMGAAGFRKKGEAISVTIDDKFHVGSCTKSMTATLGATLIEKGVLHWDTKVAEVFPDMNIHDGYLNVTFDQLVTNSAGVPGDIESELWLSLWEREGSERDQRLQLVKGMLQKAPAYRPGSKQVYSNAGFSIAGAMLEELTDQPFELLLMEHVFQPLGMKSAGFRAPASQGLVDQPYGHSRVIFSTKPVDPEPQGDNPPAIAPAGAVHCSVEDFAKYGLFHLKTQGNDLLTESSFSKLHEPLEGKDYARGWVVAKRKWAKGAALTHTGSNTMFYSVIWIAPKRNFAAVAMCNFGGQKGFTKCDEAIAYLIEKHLP